MEYNMQKATPATYASVSFLYFLSLSHTHSLPHSLFLLWFRTLTLQCRNQAGGLARVSREREKKKKERKKYYSSSSSGPNERNGKGSSITFKTPAIAVVYTTRVEEISM